MSILSPTDPKGSRIGLLIAAVLFVTVLVLSFVIPNPSDTQAQMFRVFLALFAALVAVYIPGSIGLELPGGIRAGGALAIFLVVYLFNPGEKLRAAMAPQARGPGRTTFGASAWLGALLVMLLCVPPADVACAENPEPDWVVVFDLVRIGDEAVENRVLSFDASSDAGKYYLRDRNLVDLPRFEKTYGSDVRRSRWIGKSGQRVAIFIRHVEGQEYDLTAEELPRDTQFAGDLARLVRAVTGEAKLAAGTVIVTDERSYTLARTRATLRLTVKPKTPTTSFLSRESEDGSDVESLADPDTSDEPAPLKAEVITGPREHLYLSTGVPFTSIDEFKVDDTNTVVPNDVPKKFLIGVHWQVGDILTSDHADWAGGLNVGVMLQADSKPLEHAVLAIGYRMQDGVGPGTGLQYFTPFFGLQRSEQDREDGTGAVEPHTVWQGVWGLSLNLDKALGWLKPD